MDAIFRPQKSYRNLAIVSLLFFLGMTVLSVCLVVSNGCSILASFLVVGFWGFFVALSVIVLLQYYRESLSVKDGRIVQTGIIRRREMELAEVTDVRWRAMPAGGSVVLRSASQKIKANFDNFELEQRRSLIRWLRLSLPQPIQRDWEAFCIRHALPLLKHAMDAPLRADEVLITRRRWDRFFLVLTA